MMATTVVKGKDKRLVQKSVLTMVCSVGIFRAVILKSAMVIAVIRAKIAAQWNSEGLKTTNTPMKPMSVANTLPNGGVSLSSTTDKGSMSKGAA
ncbi:hypothetical protein AKJ17_17780 [Vibrio nereis]|uniref:Uncharacterized protein n=1 Tax=Vibrio nereis TaxID=693 RepID=A0A0M0HJ00_VIBNE|nr:hypothetical protein AKJ17_17780 [Vibrio nereis]